VTIGVLFSPGFFAGFFAGFFLAIARSCRPNRADADHSTPMSIAADHTSKREPIHFSTIFDGRTPALCGKVGTPCPATSEWRYVGCERCLALRRDEDEVHARRNAGVVSLCGLGPDGRPCSTRKSQVTCRGCLDEISRRLRAFAA
jgi:hypothetical protein